MAPYAAVAAQSPSAPLRRLAAQQTGRLLAAGAGVDAAGQHQAADLLLRALQDSDVGVASAAEAGLRQLASPAHAAAAVATQQGQQQGSPLAALLAGGSPAGQALRRLAACDDPVLRLRALTLLVALASQSPAAAAAVRQSGLLEPLLEELRDPGGVWGGRGRRGWGGLGALLWRGSHACRPDRLVGVARMMSTWLDGHQASSQERPRPAARRCTTALLPLCGPREGSWELGSRAGRPLPVRLSLRAGSQPPGSPRLRCSYCHLRRRPAQLHGGAAAGPGCSGAV